MEQDNLITLENFTEQWLADVVLGNPSTLELGRRFAGKMVTQWLDIEEGSDDIFYCDGAGDGGIDIAYLDRHDTDESASRGDTWYLVQSKYGKAFSGVSTLLQEGQKVLETLGGQRTTLSSLSQDVLEMLSHFVGAASERDRLCLVFATERPLTADEKRVLDDLRSMGRARLGSLFDVESISIDTIYRRVLDEKKADQLRVPLQADLVASGDDLAIGSTPLINLYAFLKQYRKETDDLDQLYEKNVRRFLGTRGKVNRAMQRTLTEYPELFGLFNNGITIVTEDFEERDGMYYLTEPFIVNGCQTTRMVWEIFHKRLEAGGTGTSASLDKWRNKADNGFVVTKLVRVGTAGAQLLTEITRNTNTQNAIREKDFLALTTDFRTWQRLMGERYNVYLEIQRGGWDSRRALQGRKPQIQQFKTAANAFDLLKIYGAGWLGEAGLAFSKNSPFLPNGSIFKRIMDGRDDGEQFDVDDLYASYKLLQLAGNYVFGRGAAKPSRRQTKFLFYTVAMELLKEVMSRAGVPTTCKNMTQSLLSVCFDNNSVNSLADTAIDVIDSYLMEGSDNCIHEEPAFKDAFNYDLNAFLKWEKLGKNSNDTPRLAMLLAVTKLSMGQRRGDLPSIREQIKASISKAARPI